MELVQGRVKNSGLKISFPNVLGLLNCREEFCLLKSKGREGEEKVVSGNSKEKRKKPFM